MYLEKIAVWRLKGVVMSTEWTEFTTQNGLSISIKQHGSRPFTLIRFNTELEVVKALFSHEKRRYSGGEIMLTRTNYGSGKIFSILTSFFEAAVNEPRFNLEVHLKE